MALFGVVDVGLCLGDHEAEILHPSPIFREGELHFVPIAENLRRSEDGLNGNGGAKGVSNPFFFFLQLSIVAHLLPATPSTDSGVSAGRFDARRGRR